MYGKVVIPTDGSDCARMGFKEGLWMAKTLGIDVLALYVIDTSEYEGIHHESIKRSVRDGMKKVGIEALGEIEERGKELGVKVETQILSGKPYSKIVGACDESDVIYISSHGNSGWTKLFLGSTTDKVIKHARCTVSVVRGKYIE